VRAVSDEERKGKASKRDEDDEEGTSSDEERDEERSEEEDAPDGGDADAAQRVADALGVGSGEVEAETGPKGAVEGDVVEEAAAPQNRAARRADAAQRRKKRKAAAAPTTGDDDEAPVDESLPKDKNARAKELLKRRREQASEARPVQLLPGEMVDDALARSSSAVSKWIRDNFGIIQWVILAGLVGGGGYLFYASQAEKSVAGASDALAAGVVADRGRVMPEDKRSEDEKEASPEKVFKTADERADTALASYRKVSAEHAGTGAAILARLGEAGALLDKREWDKALEAFSQVSSSSLAGADGDVKGRALEGLGFAREGKGDLDGALAAFKELEGVDARGFKELGMYHQGRILLGKGDTEKAKTLLKAVHDKLEQPTEGGSVKYLQQVTDDTLRRIDPTLVPAKPLIGGGAKGGAMNKEEIEKALKKLREGMEKKEHHE
jgi:hypothetical protein